MQDDAKKLNEHILEEEHDVSFSKSPCRQDITCLNGLLSVSQPPTADHGSGRSSEHWNARPRTLFRFLASDGSQCPLLSRAHSANVFLSMIVLDYHDDRYCSRLLSWHVSHFAFSLAFASGIAPCLFCLRALRYLLSISLFSLHAAGLRHNDSFTALIAY